MGLFLVRRRPDHPQARRLMPSASCLAVGVAIEDVVAVLYRDGERHTDQQHERLAEQQLGTAAGPST